MTERTSERLMKFTQWFITAGVTIIIACMGYIVNRIDSLTENLNGIDKRLFEVEIKQENQAEQIRQAQERIEKMEAVLPRKQHRPRQGSKPREQPTLARKKCGQFAPNRAPRYAQAKAAPSQTIHKALTTNNIS